MNFLKILLWSPFEDGEFSMLSIFKSHVDKKFALILTQIVLIFQLWFATVVVVVILQHNSKSKYNVPNNLLNLQSRVTNIMRRQMGGVTWKEAAGPLSTNKNMSFGKPTNDKQVSDLIDGCYFRRFPCR